VPADAGIRFGQYVLLRRIARGGMAEVFLAQQRGLEGFDRRVAVKRILPHLADSPDFVKMFLGEAKLAAQLAHPNVVHIYDFGKVEHDYFIAMEYVDGVHAGQIFKMAEREREQLSPTMVARIGADAAAALHYAHELRNTAGKPLGLVHRDVSPANLMVSYDGVVKLCDFGIAKAAALTDQLTNPGQVKGKYAYMSPEQTIAAPLDGRSDVFSLAIVLWELLAGRTIVGRGDAVEAMRAIRDGKLPSIREAAPHVPEALAKALAWAMETKRERRATAAELTTALEAFIKASPELATPMQLAQWVRQRFPRAETGPQPAVASEPGGGTSVANGTVASPGTEASPSTMAAPGTVGSGRIIPLTPPTRSVRSELFELEDESETLFALDKPAPPPAPASRSAAAPPGQQTVLARDPAELADRPTVFDSPPRGMVERVSEPPAHRPAHRPSLEPPPPDDLDDSDTLSNHETAMRSGLARPLVANQGAIPTQFQPRVEQPRPTPVPGPLAAPGPTEANLWRRPRPPRRVLAFAALFGIALLSFMIALAAKSGGKPRAGASDASTVAIAPDATGAVVTPADAALAEAPTDARGPTILVPDAGDTTTILKVNTRPAGGTVKVRDQVRTAPAEFALPAGKHTVVIELDGWQAERREVDLPYGVDTVLEMAFSKRAAAARATKMGKLTVRTIPWSDVYLGTRKLGQSPFADLDMPAGTYTLLFKHPNHAPVRKTVTIQRNKTTKLGFNLPK